MLNIDKCDKLDFYKQWKDYKDLLDVDQKIFEQFFDYICNNKFIQITNEDLAEMLGVGRGTLQNSLTRLQEQKFIYRYSFRDCNNDGSWHSGRRIILSGERFKCFTEKKMWTIRSAK